MEESGRQTLKVILSLILLAFASTAALAQVTLAELTGRWEVVGVQVRPAVVQALTVDDPDYMGAVLEVTASRLAFIVRPGGTLDDVCLGPHWNGALVSCVSGTFGPPGSLLSVMGDQLRLEWYDNAILTLRRVR
jgi:hypothetical protein